MYLAQINEIAFQNMDLYRWRLCFLGKQTSKPGKFILLININFIYEHINVHL